MALTEKTKYDSKAWVELLPDQSQSKVSTGRPDKSDQSTRLKSVSSDELAQMQDERAARMFEIFDKQTFNNVRRLQQIRLSMVIWVIRNKVRASLKREMDLLLSLIALPIALPIFLVTAIAIKLDSPGPVLFRQQRVGKWGKPFTCFKFRSMFIDAEARKAELMALNEADEIVFKIAKDPRVTRVGRIIRKLSIDEVPQLINVMKGEMSWVGPRPPVPIEVANYKYDHLLRLNAIPGITGLQQVSGRSDIDFNLWVELDLKYIEEQSLIKDISILVRTVPAVLSGKGAY